MLLIKPSCEHCDKTLAADSCEAMICSYECTFCRDCATNLLDNVCPNCGGGFFQRPVRPRQEWHTGVSLKHQPASSIRVHKPVDIEKHTKFSSKVGATAPERR